MAEKPTFVYGNTLTEDGKKLIAHVKATILEAEQRAVDANDMNYLNGLAGPYQAYYVNVQKLFNGDPLREAEWIRQNPYAMDVLWSNVQMAEAAQEAAERQEVTEEKQTDLEARLAKVEAALTEALAVIAQKDKAINALVSVQTDKQKRQIAEAVADDAQNDDEATEESETPTGDEPEGEEADAE